jgi:hypothetical protein
MQTHGGDAVTTKWELVHVLPNFTLVPPEGASATGPPPGLGLETPHIAIVEANDSRLTEIRVASPGADKLLGSFIDHFGMSYRPAALILAARAPLQQYMWESAVVSYRTAVAMAIILRAAAQRIAFGTFRGRLYSDVFQFHPTTVADNGIGLITTAPGMASGNPRPHDFVAMPSPYLATGFQRLVVDVHLLRALTAEWERRYVLPGQDDVFGRTLFRSLDVAYQASAAPLGHGGTIHEYGTILSSWLSAIEILVWPDNSYACEEHALEFLGRDAGWLDDRLNGPTFTFPRRRKPKKGLKRTTPEQMTPVQGIYAWMNRVRNDFLHGNRVVRRLLFPLPSAPESSLMELAPVVYRVALSTYLRQRYPSYRERSVDGDTADEMFDANAYEQALLELLDMRPAPSLVGT